MNSRPMTWRRWINRSAAPVCALAGITAVFCSVMFVKHDVTKIALIGAALLIMQAGVWYMANPILTSERRYTALRDEIDRFIALVRELNRAAVDGQPQPELDRLRQRMHDSVDKMGAVAGESARQPASAAAQPEASPPPA